jgi:hypothetical protein
METPYNGQVYSNQLVARWAVFFDTLRIDFESDTQPELLPSGSRYRPNLFLPDFGLFVDIKPFTPFGLPEVRRLWEFAVDLGNDTLLIVGSPKRHRFAVLNRRTCTSIGDALAELEGASDLEIANELVESIFDWGSVGLVSSPFRKGWALVHSPLPPNDDSFLMEALETARTYDFAKGPGAAG